MRACLRNIFIIVSLIFSSLHGQEYLRPDVISVKDGLLSNNVSSLLIDSKGFLWAGTKNGLNRYNGYRFMQFFTSSAGNGYPGIQITLKVRADNAGNIWVLNSAGFNVINGTTGEIERFPVNTFDSNFRQGSEFIDIYPSIDGSVWLLTDRSLTEFTREKTFITWPLPVEFLDAGMIPTSLVADNHKNVWIGTSGGLILFSGNQKVFKEIVGAGMQGLLSNNEVRCLFLDNDNYLWVGTRSGLNYVDPIDYEFYQYFPVGMRSADPANSISQIIGSHPGNLLLATDRGIVRFDHPTQHFENIYSTIDTTINSVTIDYTGNIWAASDLGIIKLRKLRIPVANISSRIAALRPGFKLAGDQVTSLLVHSPGSKLFVGYRNDGFSVADTRTYTINHFTTLDGTPVSGFYQFRDQEYLIVSRHDIEIFTPAARRSSILSIYPFMKRELLQNADINCIFYDGNYGLWIGTNEGIQCVRIDSAKHYEKKTLNFQDQQLPVGTVYDIHGDAAGNLWLGTNNGLILYNHARGNFNRLTPYDINLLNTEHKSVYSIEPEGRSIFWLGTSAGIFRFDLNSREFTAIANSPELMNASVKDLDIDQFGNLWIGTESGLFNYIRSTGAVKRYDAREGLLNDSYTSISADKSMYVFAGGPRGISAIDVTAEPDSAGIPVVAITSVRYLENRPDRQDLFFMLPDTIVLAWNRKPLQIEFAVLDFSRPEFNQYRYSFGKTRDGAEWRLLGSLNYVLLNRLTPGKYRFSVTGSGSDMNWNNQGTSLVIVVEAPYWRSKFGLGIIITAGSILVFVFFRFWIRQFFNLSRENQEREMFAKQIMLQKEELTLKNKAITDSINYAKRIQTAMLPPYKLFKSIFPSSFILFMPKDIVSGDFYWVNKVGNKIFISAVDCTGHGVPGAFMSIIGFELFRKITNIEGLTRPSDILNRLNDDFHEIFKDVDNVVLRDGMDVAFCSIDKKDMILEFAGAFNPLYLIRDNKIMEVKGDRFAIGLDETNFREQTFKNHIIPIQKGDIIYIFSDGFSDQFGGPDGKKYKYRRFRHLLLNLHQLPMEKQHEILENNVLEWRGEQDQVDDILVIGIKIDF
jgi:ligand-binding sensor domain-containing protein/serine phosphatase RsbU (regulator of sigma subunit)